MKTKRTLAKQSLFYGAANGIEALVPFLLAPILTRMLDPTDYGIWVLFITYATFLRPFIGLSAQDAIRMRFYDFDQKQLDQFTHTVLFLMTIVMIFGSLVTYVFQDALAVLTKFPALWLISIVGAAFLFEVFYTILALNQFHGRRMAFLYAQILQAVLSMIFILIFLYFDFSWQGVILGRMLSMAVTVVISLHFLGYKMRSLVKIPPRSYYRNITVFGVSYVPSGMIIMAMAMIDKVVAAHFLGVAASALYGVAALFASAFWVVNNSFLLAWTPWLFRRLRGDEPDKLREIFSVSLLYFALSTLAAGLIYMMSLWVAPILLGEAFHDAIPLMRYIMIAILLQGFYMHNMKFLHSYKKVNVMSLCSALALAINLWLSISWAPEFGVKGIMQATMVSFAVVFVLSGIITLMHVVKENKKADTIAP
jgi:O-antigen/teichoic acid export membrane protein